MGAKARSFILVVGLAMPLFADGPALLAAIGAHPEEDTPRLVYADWLDERGEKGDAERAEFIRLQIELARLGTADFPGKAEKVAREQALLKAHWKDWVPHSITEALGAKATPDKALGFRRGFLNSLDLSVTDFGKVPVREAITAIGTLSALRIRGTFDRADASSGPNARARDQLVNQLNQLEALPRLKELALTGLGLANTHLAVLHAAKMKSLEVLSLDANRLYPSYVGAFLGKLPATVKLRSLSLSENPLLEEHAGDAVWERLGGSTEAGSGPAPTPLSVLMRSPRLGGVQSLGLRDVGLVTPEGFMDERVLPELADLDLRGNGLERAGIITFFRSPRMGKLSVLRMNLPTATHPARYVEALETNAANFKFVTFDVSESGTGEPLQLSKSLQKRLIENSNRNRDNCGFVVSAFARDAA